MAERIAGNTADIAIVAAAGLIGLLAISGVGVDGHREQKAIDAAGATDSPADGTSTSGVPRSPRTDDDA